MAKAGKSSQISKDLPVEQSCLLPWVNTFSLYVNLDSAEIKWSSLTF